jgi:hypothetical protein
VSRDGKRFLIIRERAESSLLQAVYVENCLTELMAKLKQ